MSGSEFERIQVLERVYKAYGVGGGPQVETGIGDDSAVLRGEGQERIVVSVDEQVEGTHFDTAFLTYEDIGYRAMMAAASDLAAMGAKPWCALSSMVVPSAMDARRFEAMAHGIAEAARELNVIVVGGNLARGVCLSIGTTVMGKAMRPILRSGAQPGDRLFLAGHVGLAAVGLECLRRGEQGAAFEQAVRAWRRPKALIALGLTMAERASAGIDVSDGLAQDVAHIAKASGVDIVIDEEAACTAAGPELKRAAESLGVEAMSFALSGGEDYALVATSAEPIAGFAEIGWVREGAGLVSVRRSSGEYEAPTGFDHFV